MILSQTGKVIEQNEDNCPQFTLTNGSPLPCTPLPSLPLSLKPLGGAKITGELHSNGSVKIGQSTVVIGNVFATSAVIAGAVKGDIDVQGPVILDTSAIVMGNIKSKSVQINNGAVIEGMCSQCYADVNPSSFFEEFKKK